MTTVGVVVLMSASLLTAALDRRAGPAHLVAAAVIELGALAQGVVAVVRLVDGSRPDSVPTFVGYLIGSLLVLPFGVLWALEERTRWSSVVLAVAAFTFAVVVLRMQIVWRSGA